MSNLNRMRACQGLFTCSLASAMLMIGCGSGASTDPDPSGTSSGTSTGTGTSSGGSNQGSGGASQGSGSASQSSGGGTNQGSGGASQGSGGASQGSGGASQGSGGGANQGGGGASQGSGGMTGCSIDTDCDDSNQCTSDTCNTAKICEHTAISIDDGDACTTDACNPTTGGVTHTSVDPNDNNACTVDACSPATGVSHTPIACSDGDACSADSCNPAVGCVFTPTGYFSETFASNSQGWTLGASWKIGAATVSSGQFYGNADPGADHTPTADNGLVGVVIGGNVPVAVQAAPAYLTSPVINLGGASGDVILEFWRWLNSDYGPYMVNYVEVYNGSSWVKVFQSGGPPAVQDAAWTKISYDVTAYKNASFQIRFGYQINDATAVAVSGWNVDDVRLMPALNCP